MKVFFNNDFYVGAAKYFPLKKAYGKNYKILATGASGAGYHQKDALLDKEHDHTFSAGICCNHTDKAVSVYL